jgi:hypothetical protein
MFTLLRPHIVAPCVGLILSAALSALSLTFAVRETAQPSPPPAVSVAKLIELLKPLELRTVPLPGCADPERGILLTTNKNSQKAFTGIWGDESSEGLKTWKGTLQVRHLTGWYDDPNEDVQLPGAAVWRWRRFLFFGDAELLEKVRQTLGEGEGSTPPAGAPRGSGSTLYPGLDSVDE